VPRSPTATPWYNEVVVRWVAPASTGGAPITGYTISYAPAGGTWSRVNVAASSRARTVTGLRGGTTYYVNVAAYNAAGRSAATASVRVTPRAPTHRVDVNVILVGRELFSAADKAVTNAAMAVAASIFVRVGIALRVAGTFGLTAAQAGPNLTLDSLDEAVDLTPIGPSPTAPSICSWCGR
jgi:hypothetical protein